MIYIDNFINKYLIYLYFSFVHLVIYYNYPYSSSKLTKFPISLGIVWPL